MVVVRSFCDGIVSHANRKVACTSDFPVACRHCFCTVGLGGSAVSLYKAVRMGRDIEVLASGNPKKIMRRGKNKLLGRLLGKLRIWRQSFLTWGYYYHWPGSGLTPYIQGRSWPSLIE